MCHVVIFKCNTNLSRQLEQENEHLSHQFRVNVAQQFQKMETNVTDYTQTQVQSFACIKNDIGKNKKLLCIYIWIYIYTYVYYADIYTLSLLQAHT